MPQIIKTIALMMAAVRTSETSNNFQDNARRKISEDSRFHAHHFVNLKSQRERIFQLFCTDNCYTVQ
jgi:hypothetical protein